LPPKEEAEAYLRDLKSRWKAVRNTRVVESDQRVNYRVVNGRALSIEDAN